jgi:hypothetical protein
MVLNAFLHVQTPDSTIIVQTVHLHQNHAKTPLHQQHKLCQTLEATTAASCQGPAEVHALLPFF